MLDGFAKHCLLACLTGVGSEDWLHGGVTQSADKAEAEHASSSIRKAVAEHNMQTAVATLVGRVSLVCWVQKWLGAQHSRNWLQRH